MVLIVAAAVDIVEVEARAYPLAGIDGELGLEMVFSVVLVTAFLEGDVGDGGEGVDKPVLVDFGNEEVVGLGEHELLRLLAVGKDSVQSWRAQVAERVELPVFPFCEDRVHVHVLKGIGFCLCPVAEALVHGPGPKTSRRFVLRAERVFLCLIIGGDVAVGCYLVEILPIEQSVQPDEN